MADGRAIFDRRMRSAPPSAHQFVKAVHARYEPRNDVEVHYTQTNGGDLRLRVYWSNSKGKADDQNFARFEWRPAQGTFYCEAFLLASELTQMGFNTAEQHLHGPLLAKVWLDALCWVPGDRQDTLFRALDLACVYMTQHR